MWRSGNAECYLIWRGLWFICWFCFFCCIDTAGALHVWTGPDTDAFGGACMRNCMCVCVSYRMYAIMIYRFRICVWRQTGPHLAYCRNRLGCPECVWWQIRSPVHFVRGMCAPEPAAVGHVFRIMRTNPNGQPNTLDNPNKWVKCEIPSEIWLRLKAPIVRSRWAHIGVMNAYCEKISFYIRAHTLWYEHVHEKHKLRGFSVLQLSTPSDYTRCAVSNSMRTSYS